MSKKKFILTTKHITATPKFTLAQLGYSEIKNEDAWPEDVPWLKHTDIAYTGEKSTGERRTLFMWAVKTFGDLAPAVQSIYTKLLVCIEADAGLEAVHFNDISPGAQANLWNRAMVILGYSAVDA